MAVEVTVLRLGHRTGRDNRISTHVGLVARQFGARSIIYSGEKDSSLIESLKDVVERWGGPFEIRYEKDWKRVLRTFDGLKVHLTMYGLPFRKHIPALKKSKKVMVVVGAEKVPAAVYDMADLNLAVGSQPHSEISALAVLLHALFGGKELSKKFKNAKLRVVPQKAGKKLEET